jgi:hypothetical protein
MTAPDPCAKTNENRLRPRGRPHMTIAPNSRATALFRSMAPHHLPADGDRMALTTPADALPCVAQGSLSGDTDAHYRLGSSSCLRPVGRADSPVGANSTMSQIGQRPLLLLV